MLKLTNLRTKLMFGKITQKTKIIQVNERESFIFSSNTYVHMCTFMYTCTHTHPQTHACTLTSTCMHTCTPVHTQTQRLEFITPRLSPLL